MVVGTPHYFKLLHVGAWLFASIHLLGMFLELFSFGDCNMDTPIKYSNVLIMGNPLEILHYFQVYNLHHFTLSWKISKKKSSTKCWFVIIRRKGCKSIFRLFAQETALQTWMRIFKLDKPKHLSSRQATFPWKHHHQNKS